jgi:pimeloyl-ACP methyl ester carboxylesterase
MEGDLERASINGAELAYEVSGAGEPVIFIHGSFIADTFRPLLDQPGLADRYQCILYHRRGYGGSSRTSGVISVARQAADCRELLRHLGLESAHVAGHSYGGAVALQLALDSPDVVHSLALLEPALMVGASAQGYRESLALGTERYREVATSGIVHEFLEARSPDYRSRLDDILPGAFDQAVADAGTAFEHELPGLLDWHFDEAEARRISKPVLSELGGNSATLWPRFEETHRLLVEWLPGSEGFVLPGTTHFPQIEDPQGVAAMLVAFWSRHPINQL